MATHVKRFFTIFLILISLSGPAGRFRYRASPTLTNASLPSNAMRNGSHDRFIPGLTSTWTAPARASARARALTNSPELRRGGGGIPTAPETGPRSLHQVGHSLHGVQQPALTRNLCDREEERNERNSASETLIKETTRKKTGRDEP